MKKIGWTYELSSVLTLTDRSILTSMLSRVKNTDKRTIIKLVSSFISRTKKFSSMTIWFMTYVLIIKRDTKKVSVELKKNYTNVLLSFHKDDGQKLTMSEHTGEGVAVVVSLLKDLV